MMTEIPAVRGFIRMCTDGWEQGWHERNGGKIVGTDHGVEIFVFSEKLRKAVLQRAGVRENAHFVEAVVLEGEKAVHSADVGNGACVDAVERHPCPARPF